MTDPTVTVGQPSAASAPPAVPATAIITTDRFYLRPYEVTDNVAISSAANDPEIAKNLRSRFPSPYTLADADAWIAHCRSLPAPALEFGVFMRDGGEFAGSMGLEVSRDDVIYAGTREIGYYGSRRFWGQGSEFDPTPPSLESNITSVQATCFSYSL
jgi:RimJ/RimL family protein N-acetyltransferase